MASEFNKPEPLNLNGDNIDQNFKIFKQEVEIYFKATKTSKEDDDVQVARLLNLLGKDARKVYNTFGLAATSKVKDIFTKFEEYCTPKKNIALNVFNFMTRKQKEGEKFHDFLTDLRTLIEPCEFKTEEDKLLKAMITLGIRDESTRQSLLRKDLDLDKLITFCQTVETSHQANILIQSDAIREPVPDVCSIQTQKYSRNQRSRTITSPRDSHASRGPSFPSTRKTFLCNNCKTTHQKNQCPAYGKTCNYCQRRNHFEIACRIKAFHSQNPQQSSNTSAIETENDFEPVQDSLTLDEITYHLSQHQTHGLKKLNFTIWKLK